MRQTVDFSSAEFGLRTQEFARRGERPESDQPFRILVLGDFGGVSRETAEVAARKAREIDPDNFDEVLEAMAPEATVSLLGRETRLRFRSLDDFHPDSLYAQVPAFRDASREEFLRSEVAQKPAAKAASPPPAAAAPFRPSSSNILDDMLAVQSGAAATSPAPARRPDPLDDVIRSIVQPHLAPAEDPAVVEKARLGANWDTALMRSILHQKEFRALEAAWRAIDFFIRRVPTGGEIRLSILNLSREELAESASALGSLFDSFGAQYALCIGLYEFGPGDMRALESVSDVCARAGVPFVGGGSPELLGQTTFAGLEQVRNLRIAPEFTEFRNRPNANWIGLALPRFLLRLPYGKRTSSIDSFDFSEVEEKPAHEDYLWSNPAIGVAVILASAFEQGGWEGMLSSIDPEIDRMPVHNWGGSANAEMTPCAETWMTDELAMRLMDAGFLAFASLRHRDAIRLLRLQSVSEASPRLQGAWG